MISPTPFRTASLVILAAAGFSAAAATIPADPDVDGVTAVSGKVSTDYVRSKRSDGSFQPEYYAFGKGGEWAGQIADVTLDKQNFEKVARVIAEPLAERNYLPASDPRTTKLLIMVYWGMTYVSPSFGSSVADSNLSAVTASLNSALSPANALGTSAAVRNGVGLHLGQGIGTSSTVGVSDADLNDQSNALHVLSMMNDIRDNADFGNAMMLGYDSAGLIASERGRYVRGTAFDVDRKDIEMEIEENRYFVVLMAYDFQLMWKEKKHKLLWETRFSISERRNQFDKALPVMARYASRYFGEPSNGLLRKRVLDGRVDIGDVKDLGEVAEPEK